MGRRTDIDLSTLGVRQRLRELEADYPPPSDVEKPLVEQLAIATRKALAVPADQLDAVWQADVVPLKAEFDAVIPADVARKRSLLDLEYAAVDRLQRAEWIKAGLVSIAGGDVDGMTAEQLLEYGPEELAQEIYAALVEDGKLRGAGTQNFRQPGTSGEAAAGQSPNTTAENVVVHQAAGTSTETVSATSPAM